MLKKNLTILLVAGALASTATAQTASTTELCEVEICNKLERMTLSIGKMFKDSLGKTCFKAVVPKEEAQEGKVLDSSSRWYQGSFNPTKASVTRISKVNRCFKPE